MERLTKRFMVEKLDGLTLSEPILYERYYLPDHIVIQRKQVSFIKGVMIGGNVSDIVAITEAEFEELKQSAKKAIIRKGYLYLGDDRVSVKEYLGAFGGFIRAEVEFKTKNEMDEYQKEPWMGQEITETPLAFDSLLYALSEDEVSKLLGKCGTITDKD